MKNYKSNKNSIPKSQKKAEKPAKIETPENGLKKSNNSDGREKYFLPYQVEWLKDQSQVKVWNKSRRIGATYVEAYEDVEDSLMKNIDVWFSSADESAAREYIIYCTQWAKIFDAGARELGEVVIDSDRDIKAFQILLSNGKRISALTSNPKRFRSKGGKVVLDEFAHHEDAAAMWKAARPAIMWNYPLRILSTHNGEKSLFNQMIEKIRKGKLDWSLHTTSIYDAVKDGLVEKIMKRAVSDEEKAAWIEKEKRDALDEYTWLEEYCCTPVDEGSSLLPYDMINLCAEQGLLWHQEIIDQVWDGKNIGEPKNVNSDWVHEKLSMFRDWIQSIKTQGNLYLGFDVARKKDLSVIMVGEEIGRFNYLRGYLVLKNMRFWVQRGVLFALLSHPRMYRACIDTTGLGTQIGEEAQEEFGEHKVEAINFAAGNVRSEMAFHLKARYEDRTALIEDLEDIKDDLHSVKKITTSANNIRLGVDTSESGVSGHADRFWALGLMYHACKNFAGEIFVASGHRRESYKILERY